MELKLNAHKSQGISITILSAKVFIFRQFGGGFTRF
jgi:hypothetical protein